MKTLHIIRHAKAELHSFDKKDFDRDIISKGVNRAYNIAKQLETNMQVDEHTLLISSTANRAKQTALLFAEILHYPIDRIQYERRIYEASAKEILNVVNHVDEKYTQVLIVGHNPGLSDFVDYVSDQYINLSTSECAILHLEENLDFKNVSRDTCHLSKILVEY